MLGEQNNDYMDPRDPDPPQEKSDPDNGCAVLASSMLAIMMFILAGCILILA